MRIDRMLSITMILLNRDRVSAREFSDKFEVSERTIYRDIEALNLAGIPVVSYQGKGGGFGILETFKLEKQIFSRKDLADLISMLKSINANFNSSELEETIGKLTNFVSRDERYDSEEYLDKIIFDTQSWGGKDIESEKKKLIHKAISECKLIEFDYVNNRSQSNNRKVEPMTLVFKGSAWYLFGFCRLKDDYRFFKLSRIRNPKKLNDDFKLKNTSYEDMFGGHSGEHGLTKFVLKFDPKVKHSVYDYFSDEQIVDENDEEIIVEASMPEGEWLVSMLMGYGDKLEVVEPESFRDVMKGAFERAMKRYK